MEHSLRVDEFDPTRRRPPQVRCARRRRPLARAPPPLPNLPASDVLFLKPSDAHYADYLPAANSRTQLSPRSARCADRTRRRRHGRLGSQQQSEICGPLRRPFLRGLFPIGRRRDRRPRPRHDFGRQDRRSGHGRLRRFALSPLSGAGSPRSGAAGRKLSDRRHLRSPDGWRPRAAGAVAWPHLRQPSASHRHRQPGPDIAGERHLRARSYWVAGGGGSLVSPRNL